jgi:hypothetical protein
MDMIIQDSLVFIFNIVYFLIKKKYIKFIGDIGWASDKKDYYRDRTV